MAHPTTAPTEEGHLWEVHVEYTVDMSARFPVRALTRKEAEKEAERLVREDPDAGCIDDIEVSAILAVKK